MRRAVQVHTDSAGCSRFVWRPGPATSASPWWPARTPSIHAAISKVADDERWAPAVTQDSEEREGAAVTELADLVDVSGWPEGTRLIVRRESLHPGAQQTLFPSTMFRYWGHYTDAEGDDAHMRAHAHVEDHVRRLAGRHAEHTAGRAAATPPGFIADEAAKRPGCNRPEPEVPPRHGFRLYVHEEGRRSRQTAATCRRGSILRIRKALREKRCWPRSVLPERGGWIRQRLPGPLRDEELAPWQRTRRGETRPVKTHRLRSSSRSEQVTRRDDS